MKQTKLTSAYQHALLLLTRREYSAQELVQKLTLKQWPSEEIQAALLLVQEQKYQSDRRFAESFTRMRIAQGYGPFKIIFELRQKGVSEELIQVVVYSEEYDWPKIAEQTRVKKFGAAAPGTFQEKAQQAQFLYRRGFSKYAYDE